MKKRWIAIGITCGMLLTGVHAAWAGGVRHATRIHAGICSGELTRGEVRALARHHRHLTQTRDRYWADGRLTPRERAGLHRQKHRLNHHIYRLKHNRARRW